MNITKQEACRFLVIYHHLSNNELVSDEDIMAYIDQLGSIQFDPLDQVGYNPNLVLQSRVKTYKKDRLYHLLYEDRYLVDGWDKCLSIYPTKYWRHFDYFRETSHSYYRLDNKEIVLNQVRETLNEKGSICSSDIDLPSKIDWSWAATSVARAGLEYLYGSGELLIDRKKGTRKYYNYASNLLGEELYNSPNYFTDKQSFYTWLVYRRIGAVGILWQKASDAFLGMTGFKAEHRNKAFKTLIEEEKITPIRVEGIEEQLYLRSEYIKLLSQVVDMDKMASKMHFLAPLDNMLWDRKLIKALFNFDYKWEVYVPKDKRKYGYYVLPILYRDQLVGRIEPKYSEKTGVLTIENIWWEPGIRQTKMMQAAYKSCIKRFMKYLGAKGVEYTE